MELKNIKKRLLKNKPSFKNEYYKYDMAFEVSMMIREARASKNMTQQTLAKLLETKQPSVVRWENGTNLPSLKILEKMAKIFKTHLIAPRFAILNDHNVKIGQTSTISKTDKKEERFFLKEKSQTPQFSVMLFNQNFSSNSYKNIG